MLIMLTISIGLRPTRPGCYTCLMKSMPLMAAGLSLYLTLPLSLARARARSPSLCSNVTEV